MKQIFHLAFASVFCCLNTFAQQGTEVYLADLNLANANLKINRIERLVLYYN